MGFTQGFTWQTSCSCRFRRNVPVELLGLKLLIVCCTVFIVLYVCLFPCCALEPSGEGAWVSGDVPRGGFTVTVTVFIAAKVCPKSGYTRERPSASAVGGVRHRLVRVVGSARRHRVPPKNGSKVRNFHLFPFLCPCIDLALRKIVRSPCSS
jgi:hypothetical protein